MVAPNPSVLSGQSVVGCFPDQLVPIRVDSWLASFRREGGGDPFEL